MADDLGGLTMVLYFTFSILLFSFSLFVFLTQGLETMGLARSQAYPPDIHPINTSSRFCIDSSTRDSLSVFSRGIFGKFGASWEMESWQTDLQTW
jgi:hypothetical protein